MDHRDALHPLDSQVSSAQCRSPSRNQVERRGYCCGFDAGFGGAFAAGLAGFGFASLGPRGFIAGLLHLAGRSKSLGSGGSRLTLL
jgi:hypothetical protein